MAHSCLNIAYSFIISLSSPLCMSISLAMPPRAPYQDSYCLLSWCFLCLVHPIFPSPLVPNALHVLRLLLWKYASVTLLII